MSLSASPRRVTRLGRSTCTFWGGDHDAREELMHCAEMSRLCWRVCITRMFCWRRVSITRAACGFKALGICRVIDHRMFVASLASARCKGLLRCGLLLMIGSTYMKRMYVFCRFCLGDCVGQFRFIACMYTSPRVFCLFKAPDRSTWTLRRFPCCYQYKEAIPL